MAGTGGDAGTGWVFAFAGFPASGGSPVYGVGNPGLWGGGLGKRYRYWWRIGGLANGSPYDVRVRAKYAGGGPWTAVSATPVVFPTVLTLSHDIAPAEGGGPVAFAPETESYAVAVPWAAGSVTVTPTVNHPDATVTVNGGEVESAGRMRPSRLPSARRSSRWW